ncbi:MAG: penicillin-binding protein 2 [Candidatus Omnitrophota bacterium]
MRSKVFNRRFAVVVVLFFFILSFLFLRCMYLQILKFDKFSKLAKTQHSATVILEPVRGQIFDVNNNILAVNLSAESIYAEPHRIEDLDNTAGILSKKLNLSEAFIRERIGQKKFFVWLKRKASDEEVSAVKALRIKGVGFLEDTKRYYPTDNLAAHILGFVNIDNEGLEGIELDYDDYLKGTKGYKEILRDAYLRELSAFSKLNIEPIDGCNITLTIDSVIQNIVEEALKKGVTKFNAASASAVVVNPYSGEILALANVPDFNLNLYSQYPADTRRNRAICDAFEPGSVFKIVTASAALEEKVVAEDDLFYCEEGSYLMGKRVLHDSHPQGWLTFREVIGLSSNIGTAKVAQILGKNLLYKYVKLFGFGNPTGVDLPGEVGGCVRPLSQWSEFSIASVSIGQEVSATALQMAAAISVIANGGYIIKPYVIKKIEDTNGRIIKTSGNSVKFKKRVISEKTAESMRQILKGVVETGTGKKAALKDFDVAGKTGTAQKVEENGTYSHSKYMSSFIGFAPVDNPKIAVCVTFNEPKPVYYGGTVAAPVFAEITDAVLKYLKLK